MYSRIYHIACIILLLTLVSCDNHVASYHSASSLEQAVVAVAIGSAHDKFITDNYPTANIMRTEAMADLPTLVGEKKADFAVLDRNVANSMLSLNDNLVIVDPQLMFTDIAAGFNKENEELKDEFNEFIDAFVETDTFEDILERWHNGSSGTIPEIEIPTSGRPLRVGVCNLSPPFCSVIDNELRGSSIEIVKHFARENGFVLELMPMNFSALLTSLQSDRIDILISGLTYTEERAKNILFSNVYQHNPVVVIAHKDVISDYVEAQSQEYSHQILEHSRIIIQIGTTIDSYAVKHLKQATIINVENISDYYPMLSSGRADYGLMSMPQLLNMQKERADVRIVDDSIYSEGVALAFPLGHTELNAEFNEFFAEFKTTPQYRQMYQRWFVDNTTDNAPQVEALASGSRLVVAVEPMNYPSTTIINNKLDGLEIELIRHFALARGYKLEFMQMSFASMISAVTTQKADIGIGMISVTEERQKNMLFSDPYYNVNVGVFCLDNVAAAAQGGHRTGIFASIKNSFVSNILVEDRYKLIFEGLKVTILIALLSVLLGTLLGAGVCAMNMSRNAVIRTFAQVYVTINRGLPVLVILMINFYVIFAKVNISAVLVATISFGINFAAYVSEIFRTSIISINKGQTEAGLALGFTKLQTFIYIVAPQAISRMLPVYKGEAISLIKMTSIVGYIAVQDLTKVSDIIRSRTFDAFFPLLVSAALYFLIAYIFSKLLDRLIDKFS